jgi:hypothetical protein
VWTCLARSAILAGMKIWISFALLAAACGSKAPAAATSPGEGSAVAVVLPDVPFDDLDHEQRIEFMKQKVVPVMKPIFQKHDAKEFAEFGCPTCHGKSAETGKFEMPNPDLPKLHLGDLSKHEKDDVEWMSTEVLPTMAKIIGEALATETTKGFNCLECHTPAAP